jgi:hypothetical protein
VIVIVKPLDTLQPATLPAPCPDKLVPDASNVADADWKVSVTEEQSLKATGLHA